MSITVDVSGALKKLNKRADLRKPLADKLNAIMAEIQQRTGQGNDADGNSFAAYDPSYRNFKNGLTASGNSQRRTKNKEGKLRKVRKQKAGKPGRGDVVNLQYSGKMFGAMQVFVKTIGNGITEGIIKFGDALNAAKAKAHNQGDSGRGLPQRHFFAISESQKFTIIELIKRRYRPNG